MGLYLWQIGGYIYDLFYFKFLVSILIFNYGIVFVGKYE